MRHLTITMAVLAGLLALGSTAEAQAPAPTPPQATIKLRVVLSKYQGDKRINSQPYELSLVPGQRGNVRIGSEVPVYTSPPSTVGLNTPTSYTMQQVGTQIDATITTQPDGKYAVDLTVTDRSVNSSSQVTPSADRVPNVPIFRNVSANSRVILGNGESTQFSTALDQVSNETFKVDVTLNVGNK